MPCGRSGASSKGSEDRSNGPAPRGDRDGKDLVARVLHHAATGRATHSSPSAGARLQGTSAVQPVRDHQGSGPRRAHHARASSRRRTAEPSTCTRLSRSARDTGEPPSRDRGALRREDWRQHEDPRDVSSSPPHRPIFPRSSPGRPSGRISITVERVKIEMPPSHRRRTSRLCCATTSTFSARNEKSPTAHSDGLKEYEAYRGPAT